MTLENFLELIRSTNPIDLAHECLFRDFVHAIPEKVLYKKFLDRVKVNYPFSQHIAIMGSGNWKFSLNPNKNFGQYHIKSDIDIAIICQESFQSTWEELRDYHRKNFYLISRDQKDTLKRNGENVYSGFISPKWIPERSKSKINYKLNANIYSNDEVNYRVVNMMYFKNTAEALDYYVRGFRLAIKGI